MKAIIKICILSIYMLSGIVAHGQTTPKDPVQNKSKTPKKESRQVENSVDISKTINAITIGLLKKKISSKKAWTSAYKLEKNIDKFKVADKSALYQLQSLILYNSDYKILSAIYATRSILASEDPFSKKLSVSWSNLNKISKVRPIQNLLSTLADKIGIREDLPPTWNNDWNYIAALSLTKKGQLLEAVREFKKLTPDNRNYFPASYRKAMLLNSYNQNESAIKELKSFTYAGFLDRSPLKNSEKMHLQNLANLALGRIYYEVEDFKRSIFFYRQVEKNSIHYYDALFEQSWALFMNGNPNHALGSLYSLATPFFDDKYNPESSILKAIIYFWICNYDKSRNALADFLEKHQDTITLINRFASDKSLTPSTAFKIFEARINDRKVKEIPSDVLAYVVDQPSLSSPRDQLATLLEEKSLLNKKGIFGSGVNISILNQKLDGLIVALKNEIGNNLIAELNELSKKFTFQLKQAKFLYVELLMSETKKSLGQDLHESTIEAPEEQVYKRLIGWNKNNNMSWASSSKNEVWWDEIGYHIANEESKCKE